MVLPQITPLSIHKANAHINQWMVDSIRNRDFERFKYLEAFSQNFHMSPSVNLGSVAVKKDNDFTAIALLEKIHYNETEDLYLCALGGNDGHSATLLLKTLIKACPTIRLRTELDERWKIAYRYYR